MSQVEIIIKKENRIIPKGLICNECIISPLNKVSVALVVPQEGQGNFVVCLKRQTSVMGTLLDWAFQDQPSQA